jgi:hypothetical protein
VVTGACEVLGARVVTGSGVGAGPCVVTGAAVVTGTGGTKVGSRSQ